MDADSALAVHVSLASLKSHAERDSRWTTSLASLNARAQAPGVDDARTQGNVDGGYAWVIMLAVFATLFLQGLIVCTATILYQEILERYCLSATEAGLIVSSATSVKLLCSPAIGVLYQKLSLRAVTILGGLFMSVGLLLTGFATSFAMLVWGYGVLVGIGGNMGTMSSLVILTQYFLLKRGVATAFTFCGNGISALVFPPLITWSFESFGYTQTLVIMAAIMLQTLVLGALFRPQTFNTTSNQPQDPEPTSKCKSLTRKTGLNLLARPIVLFTLVTIASLQCLVSLGQIFVSGLAIERAGMSANQIATALSIAAISEFFKLPLGFCFDSKRLRPKRTYLFCAFAILMGLLATALAFTRTAVAFTVVFAVYVFFAMGAHSQYVTIIGDLVAMDEMPNAIVLCRTLMGIVLLVVPLAIGRIKDVYDSFQLGFILYSSVHTAIVALYLVAYHWWRTRQNN